MAAADSDKFCQSFYYSCYLVVHELMMLRAAKARLSNISLLKAFRIRVGHTRRWKVAQAAPAAAPDQSFVPQ